MTASNLHDTPDLLDPQAFAVWLRTARAERGWTIAELQARSGVSKSVIHYVEMMDRDVRISTMRRLLAAFGLSMALTVVEPPSERDFPEGFMQWPGVWGE